MGAGEGKRVEGVACCEVERERVNFSETPTLPTGALSQRAPPLQPVFVSKNGGD